MRLILDGLSHLTVAKFQLSQSTVVSGIRLVVSLATSWKQEIGGVQRVFESGSARGCVLGNHHPNEPVFESKLTLEEPVVEKTDTKKPMNKASILPRDRLVDTIQKE